MRITFHSILRTIEVGNGQFLIRLIPLTVITIVIALLYNMGPISVLFGEVGGIYHGLNDAQSMDNAQLARQIDRGEGFTTKFLRPYAVMQLHNYAMSQSLLTGKSGDLFPAAQFPAGTQRTLPDTYNAPGYPYVLAAWFRLVRPQFDQSSDELSTHHISSPDRMIPALNTIFTILTAALVFGLGRRLFDDRVAWMGLAAFLASDMVWQFTLTALSTSLLMFLVTALLFCALEIFRVGEACLENQEHSFGMAWVWALALSLLLTAACLTRFPLLILLAPLLLWLFLMPRANFFLFPMIALVVIGLLAPWFWHMNKVCGNPLGSNTPLLLHGVDQDYKGNQIYCTTSIPTYERLFKDVVQKEYLGFRWHFERAWDLLGSNPMIVFFAASLLHRFKRLKSQAFLWLVIASALALIAANNLGVATPEPLGPWNVVVVLFPCMLVIGSAFFFVLLDRMRLQLWLFNNMIVVCALLLTAMPMTLTLTNPTHQYYNYPPYMPPFIKFVTHLATSEEWTTSDMPWASAWYGDHASLWLPDSVTEFQNIHDTICPSGILFFTAVTLSQPYSNLAIDEDKDWLPFVVGLNPPSGFPLPVHTGTPGDPHFVFWSDRARWQQR